MPDSYNPAVALGLHPPENSLAQTFNTIANLQQSQAHTGLYTLQAAQQARDLDAKRAYADTISRGGSLQDAAMEAVRRGGNTSDVNQLLQASSLQNELKAGGGMRASALQEFSGIPLNRARTAEANAQTGKIGVETQTAELGRSKASDEAALRKANMFLANPDQPQFLADAMDAHMAANPPPNELERANQLKMKMQLLNAPKEQQMAVARAYGAIDPTPEQRNAVASGLGSPLQYETRKKEQEAFVGLKTEHYKETQKNYENASTAQYGLQELENNLSALPSGSAFLTPGTGFGKRLAVAKALNTTFEASPLGWAPFDKTQIAAGEAAQKGTTRLGFDTAKILGSRESQMIVQQAVGIQPGAPMTTAGNARIIPALTAAAQREKDYAQFFAANKDKFATPLDAQVAFNQQHPPSQYVADVNKMIDIKQGRYSGAIKDLRANPKLAPQFDEHFGAGMSRYFLGD